MTSGFEESLGRYLAQLREERGVSQEALATELGHGQPFVSKVEAGQRGVTVGLLLRWLAALNLRLADVASDIETLPGLPTWGGGIWEREI